jgi:Abortive infection alpha
VSDAGEIAKAISPITGLVGKLFGPMADELGQYFGDSVRAYRQRNLNKVIEGTLYKLEERGAVPHAVPPRLLLPIVEAASLEDDTVLQEMWSGLFASAATANRQLSPSFVETLKQIGPDEAATLNVLYEKIGTNKNTDGIGICVSTFDQKSIQGNLGISQSTLETLERLGLMRREFTTQSQSTHVRSGSGEKKPIQLTNILKWYVTTDYGVRFMSACTGDKRFTDIAELWQKPGRLPVAD